MPGLNTTNAAIRERMLQRNFYNPGNPYDLRADVVTRTLDVFRTAGFNLRSSPLLAGLEALVDNTPLLRIAAVEIAKNAARRYADRLVHEKVPPIRLENLFSKDPSKRVLGEFPLDWTVTPRPRATSLGDYLSKTFQRTPPTTGLETDAWPLHDQDPELRVGGKRFYDVLGSAQKGWLTEQMGRNQFNRWPRQGQTGLEGLTPLARNYRLSDAFYPVNWVAKRTAAGATYGSYLLYPDGNRSSATRSGTPDTLNDVITAQSVLFSEKNRNSEGFGQVLVDGASPAESRLPTEQHRYGVGHYDANGKVILTDIDPNLHIERGLLFYTDQLAKTKTEQGETMRHNHTHFKGRHELDVVWRGSSKCRTFSIERNPVLPDDRDQSETGGPYNTPDRLMRWDGNGLAASVIGKTVVPRIAPQKPLDQRALMFSIENLAWGPADILRLPVQQRGPFGGRQMWFMPYGIAYAETATAKWTDVPLVGRIEDLHAYNGASRIARLSFILLADYPDAADKVSPTELGAWFAGCKVPPAPPVEVTAKDPILERPSTPEPVQLPPGPLVKYFFENDSFAVDYNYELTANPSTPGNLYALNSGFQTGITAVAAHISFVRTAGHVVVIKITGSCSALFTNDYNARLSYKRALKMAKEILVVTNMNAGPKLSVTTWPTEVQIENEITKGSIKAAKKYTVTSADGTVIFELTGRGEADSLGGGATEGAINTRVAKELRKAEVTSVLSRAPTKAAAPLSSQSVAVRKQAELRAQAGVSKVKIGDGFNPRFGEQEKKERFARGFQQRNYLAPVYHSQTPYDLHERHEFLIQCTRPGNTVSQKATVGSNSLYGRAPICILRLGDFVHSKILINNVSIDYQETKWDMNPEGMGMRPLLAKVSLDITLLGGQSLEGPINTLLSATDFGYNAGSTYFNEGNQDFTSSYGKNRYGEGSDPKRDQPLAGKDDPKKEGTDYRFDYEKTP